MRRLFALASGLAAWRATALDGEQACASAAQGDAVSLVQHGLRPGSPSSGSSDVSSGVVAPTVYHWEQMTQAGFEDALLHVPQGEDLHIFTYPDSVDMVISKRIHNVGLWDEDTVGRLCEVVREYGVGNFLDVGANIGSITLPVAACLAGRGHVFAVEAIPSNVQHVMASVYRNGMENVTVVSNVVGSFSDENMTKFMKGGRSKGASSKLGYKEDPTSVVLELPQTTLDLLAAKERGMWNLLAMKMDIEGSEGHALYGFQRLLAKSPPCFVQVELNLSLLEKAGTPKSEVVDFLSKVGYDTSEIDVTQSSDHWIHQQNLTACVARLSQA